MSKSRVKTMLIVFFDAKGVVHKEFVPQGQTVNAAYYMDVLERLRKRVIRVRKNIAATFVLHLDNAPSHTSLRVREFLAKHNVATLPQPPLQSRSSSGQLFFVPEDQDRPHSTVMQFCVLLFCYLFCIFFTCESAVDFGTAHINKCYN
jgi:hypothetical protein